MKWLRAHGPLLVSVGSLWLVVGVLAIILRQQLGGHVGYVLDDAYIQMAIAKHLAENGVWGVTPFAFSAASSSILWPLLLAGLRLVGVRSDATPLLLNLLCASLTLVVVDRILKYFRIGRLWTFLVLMGAVFLTPMPAVIFVGLEHSAQLLLTTSFLFTAARVLAVEHQSPTGANDRSIYAQLLFLAPSVTMVRFEGLFILVVVCGLFLLQRGWMRAVLLGAVGLLPVAVFGAVAMSNGSSFFPNSLMLKANIPSMSPAALLRFFAGIGDGNDYVGIAAMYKSGMIAFFATAIVAYLIAWRATRRLWDAGTLMLLIITFVMMLHMQFATYGWFYRYEAYLVLAWVVAIAVASRDVLPRRVAVIWSVERLPVYAATALLAAAIALPMVGRSVRSLVDIPVAARNVYDQQYQMGRFVRAYYPGQGVAANDIGAIDYLADIHLLDMRGLASVEIARANLKHALTADLFQALAREHNVKIAMLYEESFLPQKMLPPAWTKVGELTIAENVVCAFATVAFYAVIPGEVQPLREHMEEFAATLPSGVSMTVL